MQITPDRPLLLGSGSPRRRELLAALRIPCIVRAPAVEERPRGDEGADDYLRRVVADKLERVARDAAEERLEVAGLLAADTEVILDGAVLGKPTSESDAVRLVAALAGRTHRVVTRYALARGRSGRADLERSVVSLVTFRALSRESIEAYARTGEGRDKAGAYAMQGLGAFLIEKIEGSPSGVIGLPVCELVQDLQALGLLESFP